MTDHVLRVMMEGACRARLKRLWQRFLLYTSGTELELVVLALAALERLAIVEAFEVDDGDVALLGLAVNRDEAGVARCV